MKRKASIFIPITVVLIAMAICGILTALPATVSETYAASELTCVQTDKVVYNGYELISNGKFSNFASEEGEFINPLYSALSFRWDGADVPITPDNIYFENAARIKLPEDYAVNARVDFGGTEHVVLVRFKIDKAPLKVRALINGQTSAEINEGETYNTSVAYEGFVGNDTEDSLIGKGIITGEPKMPTDGFMIVPSYASSNLYEIIYVGAKIVIKANPLSTLELVENETKIITLNGSFSPYYKLEFNNVGINAANEIYAAISEKVERYYRGSGIFDDYKQVGAYKINLLLDGNEVTLTDPIRVTVKIDEKLTGKKDYRLLHFAPDGSRQILTATERDGYITFNTVELGEYVLIVPIEGASTAEIVGISIGAVAVLVLIALFVTLFRRKY